MTVVSLEDIRSAAADLTTAGDDVEEQRRDVDGALTGGPDVSGADYAEAGSAYAAAAAPRLDAVLGEYLALLRNTADALSGTAAAYQRTEDSVVATLNSIPTPWT